jgi:hypothetical protein
MTVGFARLFPLCFRYPIALSFRPAVLLDRRVTLMSALGQKQTYAAQKVMSALPPKADMQCTSAYLLWANSGHCCRIEIIRKCMVDRQDERKAAIHR